MTIRTLCTSIEKYDAQTIVPKNSVTHVFIVYDFYI